MNDHLNAFYSKQPLLKHFRIRFLNFSHFLNVSAVEKRTHLKKTRAVYQVSCLALLPHVALSAPTLFNQWVLKRKRFKLFVHWTGIFLLGSVILFKNLFFLSYRFLFFIYILASNLAKRKKKGKKIWISNTKEIASFVSVFRFLVSSMPGNESIHRL